MAQTPAQLPAYCFMQRVHGRCTLSGDFCPTSHAWCDCNGLIMGIGPPILLSVRTACEAGPWRAMRVAGTLQGLGERNQVTSSLSVAKMHLGLACTPLSHTHTIVYIPCSLTHAFLHTCSHMSHACQNSCMPKGSRLCTLGKAYGT